MGHAPHTRPPLPPAVAATFFLLDQAGVRADVADGGSRSDTPLHWAAGAGHVSLCSILLENGADLSRCNSEGKWRAWTAGRFCNIRYKTVYRTKVEQEITLTPMGRPMFSKLDWPTPGRVYTSACPVQTGLDEIFPKPFIDPFGDLALSLVRRNRVWRCVVSYSYVCDLWCCVCLVRGYGRKQGSETRTIRLSYLDRRLRFPRVATCRSERPPRSQ